MVDRSTLYRDDGNWIKMTFVATVGRSFESYMEAVAWSSTDTLFTEDGQPGILPQVQELMNGNPDGKDSPTPIYFTRKKCRDTSLGGNDAINPYYQYCENDDISQPMTQTNAMVNPIPGHSGMGRVYSENIDDNQQILYLSFGIPEYNSVSSFYSSVIVPELANWMNSGKRFTPSNLAGLAGTALASFVLLPVLPLMFIYNAVKALTRVPISKYYDLRPEMPMYYRFVNTIMIHLAVNMGLANDGRVLSRDASAITGSRTNPEESYKSLYERAAKEGRDDSAGLPEIFRSSGQDIYRIMLRRYRYEKHFEFIGNTKLATDHAIKQAGERFRDDTTEAYEEAADDAAAPESNQKTWMEDLWDDYSGGLEAGLYDANLFVGFRVEKSVDTSESFTNSTGPSPVAAAINARFDSMSNMKHSTMYGNVVGGPIGSAVNEVFAGLKKFVTGAGNVVGLGGAAEMVLGSGRVDIPDIWTESSFSKNYSFNMALRSPYGDPISIYQSIYVPLSMILAGCLPRAVGANAYTAPFLVRAYIKGMMGIPLGIIDSVNIKRGSDQFGWNSARLPTAVDVSFTIKDLSPAMYMAMTDGQGLFDVVSGSNSSFQEYLMTLGGLGLNERIRWTYKARRKGEIFLQTLFKNRLNPIAWGMGSTTSTTLGRLISEVAPKTYLPRN